jgi:predicted TIM-barrel fold metal-dependent hydrolase
MVTSTRSSPANRSRTRSATVDCDIHNAIPSEAALLPHLPEPWSQYLERFGLQSYGYGGANYPRASPNAARADAWPSNGTPPGADLPFLRQQLLDKWDIQFGVLNPLIGGPAQLNVEYGAAIATAINDWQVAEWLEPEPRLRASIVVPYEDGDLAAAEIARRATDPRFVQALVLARTAEPLGRRKYWKLYEAAERHDLPIGIHFGGTGGHAITGSGWPSFYLEDHVGMPQSFQAQIASFVFEGVFERFPSLKVVVIEGGIAWLAPLLWRMDRAWEQMRAEVPHVHRPPSELVREHVWLTTQPMEEPAKRGQFMQMLAHLDMDDHLMFATDYPHWDFDAPDQAFPERLPQDLELQIFGENARQLYRLPPATRDDTTVAKP